MRNFRILAGIATLLTTLGLSVAVLADGWDRLGAVQFSHYGDDYSQDFTVYMDDRLQRIAFRARGGPVNCDLVEVFFRNGGRQILNHRRFRTDDRIAFDLFGNDRRVSYIHFECSPGREHRQTRLVIYGAR